MSPNRMAAALFAAGLALAGCAHEPLQNIPLEWQPTEAVNYGSMDLSALASTRVQMEPFKDLRAHPELIAQNLEEDTPRPVTTRDDVAVFVTQHVRESLAKAGLNLVDGGGDVVLSGNVSQFFVQETSTYQGRVVLQLAIRNQAGDTLWSGSAAGSAKRFGHSYSAENYYETLADSLVNAISTLMQDPAFRGALGRR